VDVFVRRFAAPLLAGGAPACGRYLGLKAAASIGVLPFRNGAGATLFDGIRARAADVDPVPPANPNQAFTVMCVASHDLLANIHPDAGNLLGSAARLLKQHAEQVVAQGWPETMPEALLRHSVVHALASAVRVDSHVTWWTGSQDFHGQDPPPRLMTWPDLRRVNVARQRVALLKTGLAQGRPGIRLARRQLLEALLGASPLTPLLMAMEDTLPVPLDLRQPGADGNPTYASLRFADHASFRSTLADRALEAGFVNPAITLSAAVNQLLTSASPPAWVVVRALKLVASLHERQLFSAWMERQKPRPGVEPTPLASRDAATQPAHRLMYALWRASRVALEALGAPALDETLVPLAEEVERTVLTQQMAEMTGGFLRAVQLRLQGG
jgi:hypothetical protein